MATDITKNVTRGCPQIQNPDGRVLDARLDEEEGGSLHLKWRGLGKKSEKSFNLQELIDWADDDPTEEFEPEYKAEPVKTVPVENPSQVRRSNHPVPEGLVSYAEIFATIDELPMTLDNKIYVKGILDDVQASLRDN